jgi:hypothetical protein
VLRYIELKSGHRDDGPAWIGRVVVSTSGRTLYFDGKALRRRKEGEAGRYLDIATGEEYWVAAVKKRGSNRHLASSGRIRVEAAAVEELLALRGEPALDPARFEVTDEVRPAAPEHAAAAGREP